MHASHPSNFRRPRKEYTQRVIIGVVNEVAAPECVRIVPGTKVSALFGREILLIKGVWNTVSDRMHGFAFQHCVEFPCNVFGSVFAACDAMRYMYRSWLWIYMLFICFAIYLLYVRLFM